MSAGYYYHGLSTRRLRVQQRKRCAWLNAARIFAPSKYAIFINNRILLPSYAETKKVRSLLFDNSVYDWRTEIIKHNQSDAALKVIKIS